MKVRYNKETGELGKAYSDEITVPSPFITLTQKEMNNITNQMNKVPFVVDGAVILKDKAPIEANKTAIEDINNQLKQATIDYETAMNTPIEYSNGFTYKPSYANDTYSGLILAEMVAKQGGSTIFPKTIKDSTKLAERAVSMTYVELITLSLVLTTQAEKLWQLKSKLEAELLAKKAVLENNAI